MWNGGYRQQFISIPFRFKSSSGHFFFSYFISRGAHPFAFLAKQNASTMLRKWSFFLPFSSVLFQPIFCCFQFSRFLTRPSNLPLTCRFQFKAWLVVSMTSFRSVWPVRAISIPAYSCAFVCTNKKFNRRQRSNRSQFNTAYTSKMT